MRKVVSKEVTAGGRFDFFLDSGNAIRYSKGVTFVDMGIRGRPII